MADTTRELARPARLLRRLLVLGLLCAGWFLVTTVAGAHTASAANAYRDVDVDCWDPHTSGGASCGVGYGDGRTNNYVKVNVQVDECIPDLGNLWCSGWLILHVGDYAGQDDTGSYRLQYHLNGPGAVTDYNEAASGTGAKSHTFAGGYNTPGAYEPSIDVCDPDGSDCNPSNKYRNLLCVDFGDPGACDFDAYGPEVTMDWWQPCNSVNPLDPCTFGAGAPDGTSDDTFTLKTAYSDPDAVAVTGLQWDFDGGGSVDQTTVPAGSPSTVTHQYAKGVYKPRVRAVAADGAVGEWDAFNELVVEPDLDVACGLGDPVDADGDGVPCAYDPDGDTAYFRHTLNYLNAAGPTILTNSALDAATTPQVNIAPFTFFGAALYGGPFQFVNADIVGGADLKDVVLGLWVTGATGSASNWAYVTGFGLCAQKTPGGFFFGYDVGFCNYQVAVGENTALAGTADDFKIRAAWGGRAIAYTGVTTPVLSARYDLSVS